MLDFRGVFTTYRPLFLRQCPVRKESSQSFSSGEYSILVGNDSSVQNFVVGWLVGCRNGY